MEMIPSGQASVNAGTSPCRAPGARPWVAYAVHLSLVAAIVAFAALLRFYRLADQSIWTDEYLLTINNNAPTFGAFVDMFRIIAPQVSLSMAYFLIPYHYAQLVGDSFLLLRIPPLIISLISVVVLYRLACYLFRKPIAGFVAAICLAMSTQHIWFAQEPRQYAACTLCAVISTYAFAVALRERSRTAYAVNALANGLTPWLHPLGPFLILAQGCVHLVRLPRSFRTMLLWGGLQVLVLLPWAANYAAAPYFYDQWRSGGLTPREIVERIYTGDLVFNNNDLMPPAKSCPSRLVSPDMNGYLDWRVTFDRLYAGTVGVAVAVTILVFFARRRRRSPNRDSETEADDISLLLPLCLFIVPPLALATLQSLFHRPFANYSYYMYNSVGLYLIFAYFVSAIRPSVPKGIAIVAIALPYIYQLGLVLPEKTRTDWQGCADHICAKSNPGDIVVEAQLYTALGHTLEYCLHGKELPYKYVTSIQAACDDAALYLADDRHAQNSVWIAYEAYLLMYLYPPLPGVVDDFDLVESTFSGVQGLFGAGLADRGLKYAVKEFPGQFNVCLLRVERQPGFPPQAVETPVKGLAPLEYESIAKDLGINPDNSVVRALRRHISNWPTTLPIEDLWLALNILTDGNPQISEHLARRALNKDSRFTQGRFALGLVLLAQNRDSEATVEIEKAFADDPAMKRLFKPLIDGMILSQDCEAVSREAALIEKYHIQLFGDPIRAVSQMRCGGKVDTAPRLDPNYPNTGDKRLGERK